MNLVSFTYDSMPIRSAAPHAIYISSAGNENLDAYQYEGYSKTGNLPGWRQFKVEKIQNLKITDQKFKIAPDYNSSSDRYMESIHKI